MALHVVDFRTTAGDTGEPESDAIQPYNNGESADQTTFRRPTENNRSRTDTLRQLMREHVLLKDYSDGGIALSGGGTVSLAIGVSDTIFTTTANLYLTPFATPGGGATQPYTASTKSALSVGATVNELVFTSVQKQFEGSTFPNADANAISVEILDTGSLTVAVEGASGEENNIKITIDFGTTTLDNVIAAVAGNGTAAALVVASLGGSAVGTNPCQLYGPTEWAGDLSARFLRGGAPGVAHEITPAGFASFFGTAANEMVAGDTIAIWYDAVVNTTSTGGRVQSTPENTPGGINVDGALFNTRVEPEKIPNCIPICKLVNNGADVVFINGAVIKELVPATLWFDSYTSQYAESGILAIPLNWDRIGNGPDHNPPTTIREALDNADGRLDEVLDEIEAARNSVSYGALASLDARFEPTEVELVAARSSGSWDRLNTGPDHNPPTTLLETMNNVDGHLDNLLDEVEAARNSSVFGSQSTLDDRLEAVDTHAAITVTVGPAASGRQYEGATALYDAVNALKDIGARIIIDPGTHNLTGPLTITKPIHFIAKGGAYAAEDVVLGGGYTFAAGSEGSFFENCHFTDGGTQSLLFQADRCWMRNCNIEATVQVDGDHFRMENCRIAADASVADLRLDGDFGNLVDCSFAHATLEELNILEVDGNDCTLTRCDFDLQGGNLLRGTGLRPVYRDVTIVSTFASVGTNGYAFIVPHGGLVDGLRIRSAGAADVLQRILSVEGATVRNVEVDLLDNELQGASARHPIRVLTDHTDYTGVLENIHFKNFGIPDGASVLADEDVFIAVQCSVANRSVYLRNGSVSGVGEAGSTSGTKRFNIVGDQGSSAGVVVIENIDFEFTTALTETGANRAAIRVAEDYTRVVGCNVHGEAVATSQFSGITVRGNYQQILNNTFDLRGNFGLAIGAGLGNRTGIVLSGNTVVHDGNLETTTGIISLNGGGFTLTNCSITNNTVVGTSSWTTGDGIYLQDCTKPLIMGNNVDANSGTARINYGTGLVSPIPASAATLNQIT